MNPPFFNTIPSTTGVMETMEAPTSTTSAVDFPCENLKEWLVQIEVNNG
jgi:hypothetical protein